MHQPLRSNPDALQAYSSVAAQQQSEIVETSPQTFISSSSCQHVTSLRSTKTSNNPDLIIKGWMSPLSSISSSHDSPDLNLELTMKQERDTSSASQMLSQDSFGVRRTKRKSHPVPVFSSKKIKIESGRGPSISKFASQTQDMSILTSSCVWPRVLSGKMHREASVEISAVGA